jgi:hypothetical protein
VATAESSSNADDAAKAEYKEKLRSLRFARVPGGSRPERLPFREKPNMSWEKAIQGERRPDGSFMPYVRESDLAPITAKQMADNRGHFEKQIREIRGATPEE